MIDITVIIVSHDSESFLPFCMAALLQYGQGCRICIVDSGSTDRLYLQQYEMLPQVQVLYQEENIGFSRANNLGYQHCASESEYIVFLNPDAFITEQTFSEAKKVLTRHENAGCLGGRLLGYDSGTMQPTGRLDSTGIFRAWYGRWLDRGQGEVDSGQYDSIEIIPAACAAFLFCRREMLEQVALPDGAIFDPVFFLYKEDIELGLRIAKSRWDTVYVPNIKVYHCRGWQQRQQMSRRFRLTAATNEIILYTKHPSPYMIWALLKYILVRFFRT